jgi:predicted nucleic acid-binding protein
MKIFLDTNVLVAAYATQGSCSELLKRCIIRMAHNALLNAECFNFLYALHISFNYFNLFNKNCPHYP